MSVKETLASLKGLLQQNLPENIEVTDRPKSAQYIASHCPILMLWPVSTEEAQVVTWEREQEEGHPNVYSYLYLERPAPQNGENIDDASERILDAVESIAATFRVHKNQTLPDEFGNDTVIFAGRKVTTMYSSAGPYISHMNSVWLGCVGSITVEEPYTEDT